MEFEKQEEVSAEPDFPLATFWMPFLLIKYASDSKFCEHKQQE